MFALPIGCNGAVDAIAPVGTDQLLGHGAGHAGQRVGVAAEGPGRDDDGAAALVLGLANIWWYRFGFLGEDNTIWVHDRQDNALRKWRTERNLTSDQRSESYAIVSRLIDRRLSRPMVVVAGLARPSISAAAQVLTDPEHMNAFLDQAPENWRDLNLQAVVETRIVDGPPTPTVWQGSLQSSRSSNRSGTYRRR